MRDGGQVILSHHIRKGDVYGRRNSGSNRRAAITKPGASSKPCGREYEEAIHSQFARLSSVRVGKRSNRTEQSRYEIWKRILYQKDWIAVAFVVFSQPAWIKISIPELLTEIMLIQCMYMSIVCLSNTGN